jgi:hypothetical protein
VSLPRTRPIQVSIFNCVGRLNWIVNEIRITLHKHLQVLCEIWMADINQIVQEIFRRKRWGTFIPSLSRTRSAYTCILHDQSLVVSFELIRSTRHWFPYKVWCKLMLLAPCRFWECASHCLVIPRYTLGSRGIPLNQSYLLFPCNAEILSGRSQSFGHQAGRVMSAHLSEPTIYLYLEVYGRLNHFSWKILLSTFAKDNMLLPILLSPVYDSVSCLPHVNNYRITEGHTFRSELEYKATSTWASDDGVQDSSRP